MSTGGWILSVLLTLIILALIVAGMVWLFTAIGSRESQPSAEERSGPSAREILDRRLASGEITTEKYEQLRETIGDSAPAAGRGTGPPRSASAPG